MGLIWWMWTSYGYIVSWYIHKSQSTYIFVQLLWIPGGRTKVNVTLTAMQLTPATVFPRILPVNTIISRPHLPASTIRWWEQFESRYYIYSSLMLALYIACVWYVGLAHGIHVLIQNVVYSKKEQLVDGVCYKNSHCSSSANFVVFKLFIACKGIIVNFRRGYCLRVEFLSFNTSERMDVGTIQRREVFEEIQYIIIVTCIKKALTQGMHM